MMVETGLLEAREARRSAGELCRERFYAHYDQHASAPATLDGLKPRSSDLRALVRDHFPADRNAAILDLGCGYGGILHFAKLAGYHEAWGVDRAPVQVAA